MHLTLLTLLPLPLLLLLFLTHHTSAQGSRDVCQRVQKPRYQTLPGVAFPAPDRAGEQTARCPNGMTVTYKQRGGRDGKGEVVYSSAGLAAAQYGMIGLVNFEVKNQTELAAEGLDSGLPAYASYVYNGEWCRRPWWHARKAKTLTCYKRVNTGKVIHED